MDLNVVNCPRCGKIFARGVRDVCPSCQKEIEAQYEKCVAYLREHRGTNIQELSDETEVPIKQITKFIREGRISMVDAPNMSFPCEVCGTLIRESTMCDSCRKKLIRDVTGAANPSASQHPSARSQGQANYQIRDRLRGRGTNE